mmetsp:Transcript_9480/g.14068  ORF Transcript_9480/g.14068 Transcript_9480/m.14068 type:complete len:112 (+) Transcript_9480:146-481(+)
MIGGKARKKGCKKDRIHWSASAYLEQRLEVCIMGSQRGNKTGSLEQVGEGSTKERANGKETVRSTWGFNIAAEQPEASAKLRSTLHVKEITRNKGGSVMVVQRTADQQRAG